MDEAAAEPPELAPEPADELPKSGKRRPGWTVLGIVLGVSALALGGLWLSRETLADKIIASQLDKYKLPGKYTIDSVGLRHQVLRNVVIGDPSQPDFTAERVEIDIEPTLGVPTIGKVVLVKARLFGAFKDGKISFGKLDSVLEGQGGGPAGLPDLDLVLSDARARIETPWGVSGIKAEGLGNLKNGFTGTAAAVIPEARFGRCRVTQATAYGTVRTSSGKPQFTGPLRSSGLSCPGVSMANAALQLEAGTTAMFDSVTGEAVLSSGAVRAAGQAVTGLTGASRFTLKGGDLTASYKLSGKGLSGAMRARTLALDGMLRSHDNFTAIDSEGTIGGRDVQPGQGLDGALASNQKSLDGTLVAPLIGKLRQGLAREGRGSVLSAAYVLRRTGALTSMVVPRGSLTGGSGAQVLAVSQLQLAFGGKRGPHISGNLVTGGADLPHLTGRIERQASGQVLARFSMPEYRAGDAALALTNLSMVLSPQGTLGFSGRARASGKLPGGRADQLDLPVEGNWSAARGLSALRHCTPFAFRSLSLFNVTLDSRTLTLCPGPEGAILRSDSRGTRFAAGAPSLNASGRLGATPIRIASGPIGFAVPGTLAAKQVQVSLGPIAEANQFTLSNLTAKIGKDVTGHFTGTDVNLAAVPLDILAADGDWRFADGKLTISNGMFRLQDREAEDRFRPLVARDATLSLVDNQIVANALLREPVSDREVANAHIFHNLSNGRGSADLTVPGLLFDKLVQPDTISYLALGVIANARGTVSGTGRIDWNPDKVTSTGRFSTDKLDFAAAFGPAEGVSGSVVFDDLLGLVTAPDQRLKIKSINPGIEVNDGEVSFALQPGHVLQVNGANWPFIDGTLQLQPTRMVLGASEVRRFTLKVSGISAALFIERLQLGNLAANGYFDGELPLVFDQDGGWIKGGLLVSRPPGGNLSYIGELTYKDLSPMGNFAFQTLRSLDFRRMQIGLDGALDGDITTRLKIEGVKQGSLAKKNFITRRLAGLPIQFNVNIKAPFQRLVTSFKGLYDDSYVRDPRSLGLIGSKGEQLDPAAAPDPEPSPTPTPPAEKSPVIQPPVSRNRPR
ncbi:intermembrane phospholipid transport protein YdbH family protein [Novosphingobium sp. B 225]|uniref:intermembrane phospholipid transport protein YdbH family protein n=1 Tax=Novosphingobium sp. B 225 TaxID=1961849 RepID=UPI000B4AB663|nr:YdbH domain-containing protein [Novosphingobium sp. B 225]